jgi:hypothetical protein
MKSVSRIALGIALSLGGLTCLPPSAALGQQAVALSAEERAALSALKSALDTRNYAAAAAAVSAAQSAARTGYSRYLASALQLRLGIETGNVSLQASAIEGMAGSGATPAADLPMLYKNLGALALRGGQYSKADAALSRWAELAPNDPEPLLALAEARERLKRPQDAATLTDRAIGLRQASGQPVPEGWYKRGLKHAFDASMAPQSFKIGRDLVAAYPSPQNWRDTLLIYSDLTKPDASAKIDVMRLMRAAKALNGERDYLEFAQALSAAGFHGEAKAVLDEGVAAKMVDPAKATFKEAIATARTRAAAGKASLKALETKALAGATGDPALTAGDTLLGYGEHARAAALYRAAVQKGATQADLANLRLGTALALAGQRAEAETAFRSVAGPRAELASLWLALLSQRG